MIDTSNNTIITANAVLYKVEDEIVKFLLVQENDNNWGLPGGAKEKKDPDLQSVMERELEEELSLEPSDYKLRETNIKREFEYNHFSSSRYGKHGVVCFFLVHMGNLLKLRVSSEIRSVAWFTKEESLERLTFKHIKEGFEEVTKLS